MSFNKFFIKLKTLKVNKECSNIHCLPDRTNFKTLWLHSWSCYWASCRHSGNSPTRITTRVFLQMQFNDSRTSTWDESSISITTINLFQQMLTNIINVSSWLILNSLVPKALPDMVLKQYGDQFAKWPQISADISRSNLQQSLKTTRSLVSSLLENQFSLTHVQPLIELCMTVRLKLVSDFVDCGVERNNLNSENFNNLFVFRSSSTCTPN